MHQSNLRRAMQLWWPGLFGVAIFVGTAAVGFAMSPANSMNVTDWQVLIVLCGGTTASLGGMVWSVMLARWAYKRQMTELHADVLADDATMLAVASCGYCVGYRPGNWPWTVGGILAVTDREVLFRSAAYEFRRREIRLPLAKIRQVESCSVRISPCGLKVTCDDGQTYYLLFNILGGVQQVEKLVRLIDDAKSRINTE